MKPSVEPVTTAVVNAPIEHINLTAWLFTLKEHEYQACSSAHIASGISQTPDGRRISINVERVADNFLVQHYLEEASGRDRCRVKSRSDSFSPLGKSTLEVTWELTVRRISADRCELSNRVVVGLTDEFLALVVAAGIADLQKVLAQMAGNVGLHNEEETPLFARDIQGKALAQIWR
jgi:hypothetical protein